MSTIIQWKKDFRHALAAFVTARTGVIAMNKSEREVYQMFCTMPTSNKRGAWVYIGELLGISSNVAHNYFHNTYIRKFYTDIKDYRNEIKSLVINNPTTEINKLIDTFITSHPQQQFFRHHVLECFQNYRRRYENVLNAARKRNAGRATKEDHSITAVASSCDADQNQKEETTVLLQQVASILKGCQ